MMGVLLLLFLCLLVVVLVMVPAVERRSIMILFEMVELSAMQRAWEWA